MERVTVAADAGYDVVVGAGALAEIPALAGERRRAVVVSQPAIAARYAPGIEESLRAVGTDVETVLLETGERAKTLATVEELCRGFARTGLLRADLVIALGGGVVGDTAGFAAAVYHRGVDLLQVPTTLLGQVDAAIGGKTAVNLPEGKNLVGAFHQPIGVVCDVETLRSLPEEEFRSGLGEVVKYSLARTGPAAEEVGRVLDARRDRILARDLDALTAIVRACVAAKGEVVAADETERGGGPRAFLNYGHTLAHALEADADFGLRHGEAVAVGLVFAAELARAMGRVDDDTVDRHRRALGAVGLPVAAPSGARVGPLLAAMRRDKKAGGGTTFVLEGPAGPELVDDPPPEALARAFAAVGVRAD